MSTMLTSKTATPASASALAAAVAAAEAEAAAAAAAAAAAVAAAAVAAAAPTAPVTNTEPVTDDGDCDSLPQNGREARNLAEKHRRDKLNAYIQQLATMVPHVAESTRRLDKTAVLRFAAHGLRLQYVFGKSTSKKQRSSLGGAAEYLDQPYNARPAGAQAQQPYLTDALLQLLDSFFVALTCHGQIVVISASVEQLLGHCQSDLYGQNVLHITHPEDQALLLEQLIPRDMTSLFHSQTDGRDTADDMDDDQFVSDGEVNDCFGQRPSSPRTQAQLDDIDKRLGADRRCFTVRLARAGTRSEAARSYEIVKIDGCFRRSDYSTSAGSFPIVSQLIRRSRGNSTGSTNIMGGTSVTLQHDAIAQAALHGISGNDVVLLAMARIIRPTRIVHRMHEPNTLEYRTRHLIDGRIIDCDQRIGLVAGYMKDEVRNLSPFSFMHQDDVRWVIVALRQMYDCSSDYGESCYRLLSRNGHFIYLHTKGFLEIDKSTNKVHSFVCVNMLLDEEEGRRRVQEMKNKFSVIIKTKIPANSPQDMPASQNPQQLERIVLYLIDNLQKRHQQVDPSALTPQDSTLNVNTAPPLALVPPEASSVKNSISQSVNVVNITAAKNLQHHLKSPLSQRSSSSEVSWSPTSSLDQGDEIANSPDPADETTRSSSDLADSSTPQPTRPSVLQMKSATTQTLPTAPATGPATPTRNTATIIHKLLCPANKAPAVVEASKKLQQQISVLKRLHSTSAVHVADDAISPAKRTPRHTSSPIIASPTGNQTTTTTTTPPTSPSGAIAMKSVLSASLQDLDQSLHAIGHDARALCQQRSCLSSPVPRTFDKQLGAILVEHQKQQEILVNIKSEYDMKYNHHLHHNSPLHQHHQRYHLNEPLRQQQDKLNAATAPSASVIRQTNPL